MQRATGDGGQTVIEKVRRLLVARALVQDAFHTFAILPSSLDTFGVELVLQRPSESLV